MYYLTLLKRDAREMGYLVAESPFRDPKEQQDEYIDIRLDQPTEEAAIHEASTLAKRYELEYWEVFHITQIGGCPLTNGDY